MQVVGAFPLLVAGCLSPRIPIVVTPCGVLPSTWLFDNANAPWSGPFLSDAFLELTGRAGLHIVSQPQACGGGSTYPVSMYMHIVS